MQETKRLVCKTKTRDPFSRNLVEVLNMRNMISMHRVLSLLFYEVLAPSLSASFSAHDSRPGKAI
jgi:hypothetical protein